jgi:hypothetical protein
MTKPAAALAAFCAELANKILGLDPRSTWRPSLTQAHEWLFGAFQLARDLEGRTAWRDDATPVWDRWERFYNAMRAREVPHAN